MWGQPLSILDRIPNQSYPTQVSWTLGGSDPVFYLGGSKCQDTTNKESEQAGDEAVASTFLPQALQNDFLGWLAISQFSVPCSSSLAGSQHHELWGLLGLHSAREQTNGFPNLFPQPMGEGRGLSLALQNIPQTKGELSFRQCLARRNRTLSQTGGFRGAVYILYNCGMCLELVLCPAVRFFGFLGFSEGFH